MLEYQECKRIAQERAAAFGADIDKAYKLGGNYVFDSTQEEFAGIIPLVVDANSGEIQGLWHYLNEADLTMDDMQEIDF